MAKPVVFEEAGLLIVAIALADHDGSVIPAVNFVEGHDPDGRHNDLSDILASNEVIHARENTKVDPIPYVRPKSKEPEAKVLVASNGVASNVRGIA